ncbi:MAG: beta-N-acetylhexosaminidase [Alistipes sp.]|nr:beta-N-acetylhexosaminidase [Alistipes sp.]
MVLTIAVAHAQRPHIIPEPSYIDMAQGTFTITEKTKIVVYDEAWDAAEVFAQDMQQYFGSKKPLRCVKRGSGIKVRTDKFVPEEGYELNIQPHEIFVTGGSEAGIFYGLQTLRQMIVEYNGVVPCCFIADEPQFAYRGVHFDVSRHFFSVEEVKRYIDILAAHKVNRLHWHLTDDQGWRIEIKAYPELTEKGSMRKETLVGHGLNPENWDGKPHGGYYTQEEVRDIVAYAAKRSMVIIPEIEMPGHSQAALHALPWLGCEEQIVDVWTTWGVTPEVLCAGKESTYEFLQNVLDEVVELFPSEIIHIGGDECPKDRWKECEHCQAKMKAEGIESEEELQGYLVARIEKYLNTKGRRIIGWDEILEGGVTPTATVMAWRGAKIGVYAAERGNEVVMTPLPICYFDFYQTESREGEGLHIGGHINFEKVYGWDPYEGITDEARKNIIGVQCNLWSEYLKTMEDIEIQLLPRLAAMCEVQWATERRDESTIREKMNILRKFYEANGWHYAPYYFDGRK